MTRRPNRKKLGKRRRREDDRAVAGAKWQPDAESPEAARSSRGFRIFGVMLAGLLLAGGFLVAVHFISQDADPDAAAPQPVRSRRSAPASSTRAVPEMPRDIDLKVRSALVLSASGRASEAVPILEKCLEQLRRDPSRQSAVSYVHFAACVALRNAGRPDEALGRALAYLRDHPEDPPHNLIAGTLLYDRFRYNDAALRLATGLTASDADVRRVAMNPNDIHCQLADCYRLLGRAEEARKTVDRILAKEPDHYSARRTLGLLAFSRLDYSQAMELFESLHRQNPADPMVAYNVARTGLEIGQPERAVEAIRAHWKTGAEREESVCLWYAKALAAQRRYKEAYREVAALLILNPAYEEAYFVLANALTRLDKPDLAGPFHERYLRRGKMRAELDRAATAAGKGYPSSAAYYRGCAFAEAERFSMAMTEFRKARRLAPRNGQIVAGLASVFLNFDRPLDARDLIEDFGNAAEKQELRLPAELFIVNAQIAWTLGDPQASHKALQRAIAEGRRQRDIARSGARFSLLSGDPAPVADALRHFEETAGAAALDPEMKTWTAIKALVDGKAEAARDILEAAFESIPSPDPVALLALGRAHLQLGNRKAAAEVFRSLIEKEELLRPAWSGIKEASAHPQEVSHAELWLNDADGIEDQIRAEWQKLRGEREPHRSAEALIRVSGLRSRLGMRSRARALALLARDADIGNPEVHRQILALFVRREDIFVRLHSLEYLVRLVPADHNVAKQRVREYGQLGIAVPATGTHQQKGKR